LLRFATIKTYEWTCKSFLLLENYLLLTKTTEMSVVYWNTLTLCCPSFIS